jgi:hypothetical protein
VAETLPLSEVGKKIEEAMSRKRSDDGLIPGRGKIGNVGIEVAGRHNVGVALESREGFLEEGKVIKGGRREVSPDKGCSNSARYNKATENIWPMKHGGLNGPAIRIGSSDKRNASLVGESLRADNSVAKGVFGVDIIRDLGFSGKDNIKVALLEFANSNGQARVAPIAEVKGT